MTNIKLMKAEHNKAGQMQKKISLIIMLIVFAFPSQYTCYAKQETDLKVYSNIKDIVNIYVDGQLKGQNVIEVKNIGPGSHYVKATENGALIYGRSVDVPDGQITTILIEAQGQIGSTTSSNLYEKQLEYNNNRLDVVVRSYLVGESYTYGVRPGWHRYGYGAQNTISTVSEVSDWAIVKGGLERISDVDFLILINEQEQLKMVQDKKNTETTWFRIDAVLAVIGFGISLSESSVPSGGQEHGMPQYDEGRLVGGALAGCVFASASKYYYDLNNSYHISPTYAAEKVHKYNLKLKENLGLPADYEPQ